MSHSARTSLTLAALLSLTTSLTSLAGVALAGSVPTTSAAPPAVVSAVPPSPAAGPARKPVRKPVVRVTRKPAPKPAPKPTPTVTTHHATPKPVATTASPRPKPSATRTASASLSPYQRLMREVDRIPGYRDGDAVWVLREQSNWGLALMGGGTVYIDPDVPSNRLYDVVSHEWSHLLSVRDYGNDVQTALDAMNAYFGGSGLTGAERAADCMAKLLGASWTHYTPCTNTRWVAGAKKLIAGQRV